MASIERRRRSDGGMSYRVKWRLGGSRAGRTQSETFTTLARAERFRAMVEEAGHFWPEGWTPGWAFTAPPDEDPVVSFADVMRRYIDQLTGIQPDTRERYRRQVGVLQRWECCRPGARGQTYRPFDRPLAEIEEEDIRHWVNMWPAAAKTKKNYLHALLSPGFEWAVRKKWVAANPCRGVRLEKKAIHSEVRYLTPEQFRLLTAGADPDTKDLLVVAVGTGLRWGEISALWASDVNLSTGSVTIDKAWKEKAPGWEQDSTYRTLTRRGTLRQKHAHRSHYLGAPKSRRARRTVPFTPQVRAVLERRLSGKAPDDFVFTSPTGRPLQYTDFLTGRWQPLVEKAAAAGLPVRPRFHDLRHTHAVWLITAG
ncbi:MAG: tyrosine-type recombinase/integrase, partial [Actinomycetota bacterium]|nr:tyrosine-type recombinase/integrase [Actinomycetota bacterium]